MHTVNKIFRNPRSFVFSLIVIQLSGCPLFFSEEIVQDNSMIDINYEDDSPQVESFDILLSRGSLTGTEFEHHVYSNNSLIQECGTIERGRFLIQQQSIRRATGRFISSIAGDHAQDLAEAIEDSSGTWEKPGRSNSVTDPGEIKAAFNVEGIKQEINTSLDSITLQKNDRERELNRFIRSIRGIKKILDEDVEMPKEKKGTFCGHLDFYGLGIVK